MPALPQPPLLLITDRTQAARPLDWVIAAALEGGVRWISLREKDLDATARRVLLRRLLPLTRAAGALLMVHDDLAAAIELNLDGVHLPAAGQAGLARQGLPHALIGQSWHGEAAAAMCRDPALDYLTLSPIYLTDSKPGYGPGLGAAGLRAAAAVTPKPLVALGGIDADRIAPCRAAGAAGFAVMGAVMRAADPATLCAALVAAARGK